MAQRLADWVTGNIDEVKVLTRRGVIPSTIITRWNIYTFYSGLTSKSKMQRYQDTADALNICVKSVTNAIKEMEKTL